MAKETRQSRKKLVYEIDIGRAVAKQIEKDPQLSYQSVADFMGIGKAALIAKTKLAYFGTADTILSASKVCGVNFFEPYLQWLKKEGIPSNDEYASMKLLLNSILNENEQLKSDLNAMRVLNQLLIEKLNLIE